MDTRAIEAKFLSVLDNIRQGRGQGSGDSEAFPKYFESALASETTMRKYFDWQMGHTRYVRDSIEGRTLIDAGCGAGALSILLSLMGAKKVYAVDYLADQIAQARFAIRAAGTDNVELVQSDVASLDLPAESIDGIFSIEGISHYRHYPSFLEMAARVLKHGGFLVVSDGNNSASPILRRRTQRIWDAFENCPDGLSIYGHEKGDTCYLAARMEIIRSAFPQLEPEQVRQFAGYTFGYSKASTIAAVKQFMTGDYSLRSEYGPGKCPFDPESDCYMEALIHPGRLVRELRQYGFTATVKANGPANRRLRLLQIVWGALSPLTILLPRGFSIIARKMAASASGC